jgi:hypothetical protein
LDDRCEEISLIDFELPDRGKLPSQTVFLTIPGLVLPAGPIFGSAMSPATAGMSGSEEGLIERELATTQ